MPFDPSTATTGFDPSSATTSFDPTSATEEQPKTVGVGQDVLGLGGLDIGNKGPQQSELKAMQGNFMNSTLNGFGGLVARKAYEMAGVPHSQVNQALVAARQKYAQEAQENTQTFDPGALVAGLAGSADPSWFINPASRAATPLARIVGNAGAHAVMGSADDAAYQIADEADGIKKDFDIKQNLQAAGFNAAFGAAHPIVSDYVTGLFKQRGVDTLPPDNPTQKTTPLSGEPLSSADQASYQNLLNTGSEEDIKQFFAGRNGPQPSWADVHEWVGRRDAVSDNIAPPDYADEMFRPQIEGQVEAQKQAVQNHIDQQTKDWTNKPDINVVHSTDLDLPDYLKDPSVIGAYGNDGRVHIVADRVGSPEEMNAALYHEALGHYGLAQKFGDRLDSTLQTLMDRNVGKFNDRVDAWQKQNPGAYDGNRLRAAEEVLAKDSEKGQIKPVWLDALTANIKQFGRRMGVKFNYSDNEINTILGMSHSAVVNGKGRDVVANGFRNMYSGKKATQFDPESAFEGLDGNPRNEISDDRSELNHELPMNGMRTTLGNILDHPDLYKNYPQLRDMPVVARDLSEHGVEAAYLPHTKSIVVDPTSPDPHSAILHEVQHAVQAIEGHANGGGRDVSNEDYKRLAGEIEARDTEARRNMSPEERSQTAPYSSEDTSNVLVTPPFESKIAAARFMRRTELAAETNYEIKSLQETYDALDKDYTPTSRSWDDLRRNALEEGFSPSQIKDLGNVGELDKKMYRMGAAAHMLDMKLDDLNKKLDTPNWSMQDKSDYIKAVSDYNYMLQRIRGNRSELARALNVSKAIGYTREQMQSIDDFLKNSGDTLTPLADNDTFMKFARMVKQLQAQGNRAGGRAVIQSVMKPYWWQYALSFRQNMMLSALSTHGKAMMDMTTNAVRDLEETALSLPLGTVRSIAQGLGMNVKGGVHPTELAGQIWGLIRSASEARTYKDTLAALKQGFPPQQGLGGPPMPNMPGVLGLPTRAVAAQDTFMRSFLHNSNLYRLGNREARRVLLNQTGKASWDDVTSLGSSYARNPTPEMLDEAHEDANQTILMNRSPINSAFINQLKGIRPNMNAIEQAGAFAANLFTTFTRVSSNAFINQVIRRSPFSFLDPVTRADFAAGGPRRDIAITRTLLGTALMVGYWNAADPNKDKIISEGLDNSSKRAAMMASGWRPNSIHENGQYKTGNTNNLSLLPWDIHNNVAVMVGGLRQAYEQGRDTKDIVTGLKMAAYTMVHEFASSTFVNDLAPAVDAFTSRGATLGQKAQRLLANEGKTFLPNITTQAAKIIDPTQRDTGGTIAGTLQQSIPGLSQNLPAHYSVYGEPMQNGTTIEGQHNFIGTGNHTNESDDPTIQELHRLETQVKGTLVSPVQKTIKISQVPIKLTDQQYEDYQKYAGQSIVMSTKEAMQNPSWGKMSDQDKVDYVRGIEHDAKTQVRDALIQQDGWINSDQINTLRKQLNAQ